MNKIPAIPPQRARQWISEWKKSKASSSSCAASQAPPTSADDVAGTLRKVRELSRIAEQELHAVILACTRARQRRLATSTMTKPTIH